VDDLLGVEGWLLVNFGPDLLLVSHVDCGDVRSMG